MKYLTYLFITGLLLLVIGCELAEEIGVIEENASCESVVPELIELTELYAVEIELGEYSISDDVNLGVIEKIIDVEDVTNTFEPDKVITTIEQAGYDLQAKDADYLCRGLAVSRNGQGVVWFYKADLPGDDEYYIYGFWFPNRY